MFIRLSVHAYVSILRLHVLMDSLTKSLRTCIATLCVCVCADKSANTVSIGACSLRTAPGR